MLNDFKVKITEIATTCAWPLSAMGFEKAKKCYFRRKKMQNLLIIAANVILTRNAIKLTQSFNEKSHKFSNA